MQLPLINFAAFLLLILQVNATPSRILPTSSFISIENYTESFFLNIKKCVDKSEESVEEALKSVKELNRNISSYFENLLPRVPLSVNDKNLKNFHQLQSMRDLFGLHSDLFLRSVVYYKQFKHDNINHKQKQYNDFVRSSLEKFDKTFIQLFDENVFDEIKPLYDICKMKKSEQQFFDDLLKNLQLASAQAYATVHIFHELSESTFDETSLKYIITMIHHEYRQYFTKFQTYSEKLSKDFYVCESSPPNAVSVSKAIQLNAFEKYFFSTDQISPGYPRKSDECPEDCRVINNMKTPNKITCNKNNNSYVEDYWKKYNGHNDEVCHLTKKCNNIFCPDKGYYSPVSMCLNPTSGNRYQYYFLNAYREHNNKFCTGVHMTLADGVRNFGVIGGNQYCLVCDCICGDNDYYISTAPSVANVSDHKVVVGSKFVLKQNTLYIQVLQARVLPNGNIDSSTVSWKPIIEDNSNRVKLAWQHMRWIDLSQTIVPRGRVVTGLKFEKINHDFKNDQSKTHRVVLSVYSSKYNSVTGRLEGDETQIDKPHLPTVAQKELQLSGTWLPSEILTFQHSSWRMSKNNEFVAFTASGERGGGHTTIPLLDAQEVIPPTLTPLSGVGLIYSGIPSFAGYIGLKLVEYSQNMK